MQTFDLFQARHFCSPANAVPPGSAQSLATLHKGLQTIHLKEGSPHFVSHRASLLIAVERWLLFGVGNYKRAVQMVVPCNAPWAHVTLYYSSFFAANAILGMFGVWISASPKRLVDVVNGVPNSQELRVSRPPRPSGGYGGSHVLFWELFYQAAAVISPWAPPEMASALMPVNNDPTWLIRERNAVNYDSWIAFESAVALHASFTPTLLKSLRGSLAQQLVTTEKLLLLACRFASDVNLDSAAFAGLACGSRKSAMKSLVRRAVPNLAKQSVVGALLS